MVRKIIGKLQPLLYHGVKWYYRKPRWLTKRGIKIHLYPTVFHPGLYLSTDIFLDHLLSLPIDEKSVLEMGAGNGFTSLYLAKNKQCKVTATDINPNATKALHESALHNNVDIEIIHSDLFDNIPFLKLDYIIVNPPYYARAIDSVDEYAFFCGERLEYFENFFRQLVPYLQNQTKVLMILSETAPLEKIKNIAGKYNIRFAVIMSKRKLGEMFFIYEMNLIMEL